jgi:hypothetical protein
VDLPLGMKKDKEEEKRGFSLPTISTTYGCVTVLIAR